MRYSNASICCTSRECCCLRHWIFAYIFCHSSSLRNSNGIYFSTPEADVGISVKEDGSRLFVREEVAC